VGCEKEMEMLQEKTPFKVKFIDEFFSQSSGNFWLIKHVDEEQLCYPKDEINQDAGQVEKSGLWKKISDNMKRELSITPQTEKFPCLAAFLGSAGGFVKIEEDGSVRLAGGSMMGGKLFLAMGKLLLGTASYTEIIALAEKGDRRNTDTQVMEVFSNKENSPYGQFEPDSPIFPFGKAADQNKGLEQFRKEDLAASLVNLVAGTMISLIMSTARAQKVQRIYIGGNMCRSLYFRKIMMERPTPLSGMFNIQFLKTGHTAAMGAMIADESKENSIF